MSNNHLNDYYVAIRNKYGEKGLLKELGLNLSKTADAIEDILYDEKLSPSKLTMAMASLEVDFAHVLCMADVFGLNPSSMVVNSVLNEYISKETSKDSGDLTEESD